jgi:hypothetical protein
MKPSSKKKLRLLEKYLLLPVDALFVVYFTIDEISPIAAEKLLDFLHIPLRWGQLSILMLIFGGITALLIISEDKARKKEDELKKTEREQR